MTDRATLHVHHADGSSESIELEPGSPRDGIWHWDLPEPVQVEAGDSVSVEVPRKAGARLPPVAMRRPSTITHVVGPAFVESASATLAGPRATLPNTLPPLIGGAAARAPLTVQQLRVILDRMTGDLPVVVADDDGFDPLRWAEIRRWRWVGGWGGLEHAPEPDDEPGGHEGFTPAVVLSAKDWTP